MKQNFCFIVLLFTTTICFSQSLESLKTETKNLYDANYTMDFEGVVALTYPKVVATIGKDTMLDTLDLDYQNLEYRMRLVLPNPIFKFGEIKKVEGKVFCVIQYKNPVRFTLEKKSDVTSIEKKLIVFKEISKANKITYEPKRNSFYAERTSFFIAVSDATTNQKWKFFNLDDANQNRIFQNLFGINTKKELGL